MKTREKRLIQVTDDEVDRYFETRKKIESEASAYGTITEWSKYSINSWKASGLPINKYLYIADFIDTKRKIRRV